MYLVQVVPISKQRVYSELSYYTTQPLTVGALVFVPFQKREIPALVVDVTDATTAKTAIKKAGFAFRKIGADAIAKSTKICTDTFLDAVRQIAESQFIPVGVVLYTLTYQAIQKNEGDFPNLDYSKRKIAIQKAESIGIQGTYTERVIAYTQHITENTHSQLSTILIAPIIHDAQNLYTTLKEALKTKNIFLFHSKVAKKQYARHWQTAVTCSDPVVVIGTPSTISLPRTDIGTIIIERENSSAYRQHVSPYLNFKNAIVTMANSAGARQLFGDTILSVETYSKTQPYPVLKNAMSATPPHVDIIDIKQVEQEQLTKKLVILSPQLISATQQCIDTNRPVFFFVARRGVAGSTVCRDCGTAIVCPKCHEPLILHGERTNRGFICHVCGHSETAQTVCSTCNSWRLEPVGIGIDRVQEAVQSIFPTIPLSIISSDHTKKEKEILAQLEQWKAQKSILLGTALALPYLTDYVPDMSAVVSLDSLFSIPDFSISSRVMYVLEQLRECTQDQVIVQTRNSSQPVLSYFKDNNREAWYQHEFEQRKQFGFPPFTVHIKVMIKDKDNVYLKETLSQELANKAKVFASQKQNELVIVVDTKNWPEKSIIETLKKYTTHCGYILL